MFIHSKIEVSMGGKDSNFDVVYRGDVFHYQIPGRWVFFQREKVYGGGYWLGQAYDDFYLFGIERPVSLREGIDYILACAYANDLGDLFDADFELN